MSVYQLKTPRLLLRQWQPSDYPEFARLNGDAQNMRFFVKTLDATESTDMAKLCRQLLVKRSWGMWAVEELSTGKFIGMVGLHTPEDLPFSPCTEIGWRLLPEFHAKGYATEAAQACLELAFKQLQLTEVVAFTALPNLPSQAVMQRLGMHTRVEDNFDHPKVPADHPLLQHCLYRITQSQWLAQPQIVGCSWYKH